MYRCASEVLALALLASTPAVGQERGEATLPRTFDHVMAQAHFLLKAGRPQGALDELLLASVMDEGREDHSLHVLLARQLLELGYVGEAINNLEEAFAFEPTDEDAVEEAENLYSYLGEHFGKVLVIGGHRDNAWAPAPVSPLLDPLMGRCYERALETLVRKREPGSTSVWLPAVGYRVGQHIVRVANVGVTRMDLRPEVGAVGNGVYGERLRRYRGSTAR